MPLLLIVLLPVSEIILFIKSIQTFGFLDTFFYFVSVTALGIFIVSIQSKSVFGELQSSIKNGKTPDSKIIHQVLIILGGIFLIVPGFLSDVFGFLFILPGIRHIFVLYIKFLFAKKLIKFSNAFVFTSGFAKGFGGFNAGGFKYDPNAASPDAKERDATVIDVKPISIETKKNDY